MERQGHPGVARDPTPDDDPTALGDQQTAGMEPLPRDPGMRDGFPTMDHLGAELEGDPMGQTVVRSSAATDTVVRFEHHDPTIGGHEPFRRCEAGETGTDYDDVDLLHAAERRRFPIE
jgi:hypothetical protein